MFDFIYDFKLSLISVAITYTIPFFYFFFHLRYWYNLRKLNQCDVFLKILCILGSIVIFVRAIDILKYDTSKNMLILLALHLAPLMLTMLIVSYEKRIMQQVAQYTNSIAAQNQNKNEYQPCPINNEIERLSWDDLIIGDDLKRELASVAALLRNPMESQRYGIDLPKGILFTGAPGTGKTTIAKVMANEAGMNFFVLSSDAVISKWVGESEKNLSRLFVAAKKAAPAIIFIDEVDSIGRGRGSSSEQWADNLLNHLLQLIDGVVKTNGLYIIAATNRAELVDDALKRAGRLNKVIEIPLPDFQARIRLFRLFLSKLTLAENIDLAALAQLTQGKSGADIKAICQQAGVNAFKREANMKNKTYSVNCQDLEFALREFLK